MSNNLDLTSLPKFKYGTTSRVNSEPIVNHSILVDIETGDMFVDLADSRMKVGSTGGGIEILSALPETWTMSDNGRVFLWDNETSQDGVVVKNHIYKVAIQTSEGGMLVGGFPDNLTTYNGTYRKYGTTTYNGKTYTSYKNENDRYLAHPVYDDYWIFGSKPEPMGRTDGGVTYIKEVSNTELDASICSSKTWGIMSNPGTYPLTFKDIPGITATFVDITPVSNIPQADPGAVRKVVDASSLEAADLVADDLFVVAGNDFTEHRAPVWSPNTSENPLNDRLLRGHTYRSIRTSTSGGTDTGDGAGTTSSLLDITPTIMSVEELVSADTITVWPCRAYKLTLANDTTLTAEGGATGDIPDFSGGNTGNTISRDLRQESFIDINPGSHTVSADSTLVIVDEIIPNVVNHCRIVWTGKSARLYVYEAEIRSFVTSDVYIIGTVNNELTEDLSTRVSSLPPSITPTFAIRTGYNLPDGLTLESNGILKGTPTVPTSLAGAVNEFITYVTVSASGYMDSRMKLTFEIAQQGNITTPSCTITGVALASLNSEDVNLAKWVSVSNSRDASYVLASGSALPLGIDMSKSGVLSGQPDTSGNTTTRIIVSARGCPDATLTVTFNIAKGTITTKNISVSGVVNTQLGDTSGVLDSNAASTNNGQICHFAVAQGSAPLPTGLNLIDATDTVPAKITGIPTAVGTSTVTLDVTANQCTPSTIEITFNILNSGTPGTIDASNQTVNGTKGQPLTHQLVATASNGAACTFARAEGAEFPTDITMSDDGKITGTPATKGTSNTKVKVSANGCTDVEITVTFVIADSVSDGTIEVTTNPTIQGIVGTALSPYDLAPCVTVSNGQTPSFSWYDTYAPRPKWLTLTETGMLSGIPSFVPTAPDGKVTVSANGCSSVNLTITWDIIAAGIITVVNQTIKGTVGKALSPFNLYDLTDVSNSQTPTFAVKSGTLPTGIDLSPEGVFTGTPSATSSATVVVKITARGCPDKDVNIKFDITEAQSGSDDFPVSFTVVSVTGDRIPQDSIGTYIKNGNTATLDGVAYPIYSFTSSAGKTYYIHINKYYYAGGSLVGTSWVLNGGSDLDPTHSLSMLIYGSSKLKDGTYEPSSTSWQAMLGSATVSWEMGNAGTPALTAKAFGHPDGSIAAGYKAVLQKYTYTGTFTTVGGETFPYYTGNGSTPWYLFGGKGRANIGSEAPWFYVVYLSSKNPTTISSWTGLEFTWGVANYARLIMAGGVPDSSGPAPTYSEVSGELSTTLLNSGKWWCTNDSEYFEPQRADTITWE